MQDNAPQHTGSTVQYWQQTQFQILVKLLNGYIQMFLLKMVVGILITQIQKIDDWRYLTKVLAIRMTNHLFPYPEPVIITSIA